MPAPIALFVYNRPQHTALTLEALRRNEVSAQTDLYVFSDGPRRPEDESSVSAVRSLIRQTTGFRKVHLMESQQNKGLSRSIIGGVSRVLETAENVIVMEDDIVTSPYFLDYMNQALTLYQHDEQVISIHGYVYPVRKKLPPTFFLRGADCWGWATWRRGWSMFEPDGRKLLAALTDEKLIHQFDYNGAFANSKMLEDQIHGKNDSWAIRWHASAFLRNKLTLYPGTSLVRNIGLDNSGTHSGVSTAYDGSLQQEPVLVERIPTIECEDAIKAFADYLQYRKASSGDRWRRLFRRFLGN
jgi:hypothetical protein